MQIYGCIISSPLWHNIYSSTLRGLGFNINPYGRCVTKNIIDRKKYTLVWYAEDNKLSHVDPNVVTNILNIFKGNLGIL